MRFRYALPILLFIASVQAEDMSETQETVKVHTENDQPFSFKAVPGEAVVITFKSAEDRYFKKVEIEAVSTFIRGLTEEEFNFCTEQDWITDGVVLDAGVFRRLNTPLVYVFLKDQLPLYVGLSTKGIARPYTKNHGAAQARAICHDVRVYFCREVRHAHALESYLIAKFQPPYNNHGVYNE